MLCRRLSSSSIRDRREAVTVALRRDVSTFPRPARTLDPAKGSSSESACAPSLSSSSSEKPRPRHDRGDVVVVWRRLGAPPTPTMAVSPRSWDRVYASFCKARNGSDTRTHGQRMEYTRAEPEFGIVDALAHTPLKARRLGVRDWEGYRRRTRVARCDGAGVVPGVDDGGRVEL